MMAKTIRKMVTGLAVPAAVAALVLASGPATASPSHSAAAGAGVSAGTVRNVVHMTLRGTQCTALRQSLHNRAAKCSVTESLHLTAVRQASTGYIEWSGYLQACAVMDEQGVCDPNQWWVTDNFNVTLSGSQVWNNGTPQCAANHTSFSWCSYADNGQYQMQEGFNFGSDGWARLYINANATYSHGCNSYASCTGQISPV